jgi:putative membrane protein
VDSRVDRRLLLQLTAASAAALPGIALAFHEVGAAPAGWRWDPQPWLTALLAASALLYAWGVAALWRKAGVGRGIRAAAAARFAAGWAVLAIALLSPLDPAAAGSFGLHMVQHELLMVVAAPLLVLGRPREAWAWALPRSVKRALAAFTRLPGLGTTWRWITEPAGSWVLHAAALWTWHLPSFFDAALASQGVHALQHASFFGSALAFWWAVLGRGARQPDAACVASLFTTMLHTSLLGALLALAPTPWYAVDPAWLGLTALEDQQLGGMVMWLPGGLAYLVAGLAIVARWLRAAPPPPSRTGDSPAGT